MKRLNEENDVPSTSAGEKRGGWAIVIICVSNLRNRRDESVEENKLLP